MKTYDAIIIGAGASGLIAAEIASRNQKQVLLIEKMDQAGRKLRITGKGRCNLTNLSPLNDFLQHVGSDSRFLRNAFSLFFSEELITYLEGLGLEIKTERGNRVFPKSDKAQDIFFAFIKRIEKSPYITLLKNTPIQEILVENNKAIGVKTKTGKSFLANKVVLATGGCSYPATGSTGDGYAMAKSLGHTLVEPYPALVPLICKQEIPPSLHQFTIKNCNLSIYNSGKKMTELFGEMRFHENGIDGPIVLTLSRFLTKGLHNGNIYTALLDFKPALESDFLDKKIITELNENGRVHFSTMLRKWMPEALIPLALNFTGISANKLAHQISALERKKLIEFLKEFPLDIMATKDFKEAIITQGGISLKEINPKTMESKLISNLLFAGEIMDLDADTGGYNLQIAFTTGYIAGINL